MRELWAKLIAALRLKRGPEPRDGETFSQWFRRQGFKHFRPEEFLHFFRRPLNSEPPRDLWMNIVPTLRILDELREVLDAPVVFNSTYRAIPYNRSVGSPDGSQHVQFRAIDFRVPGYTPHEIFRVLKSWRDQGRFVGGLGLYRSFVHLDTRSSNATWDQS